MKVFQSIGCAFGLCLMASSVTLLPGCGSEEDDTTPQTGDPDYVRDDSLNIALTSTHEGADSHEMGNNCMTCHQNYGPGPGIFTAAGTIYQADGATYPGGIVELWTGAQATGDLVSAIEVDTKGNFYTTEPLPLPDMPLYPFVRSPNGESYTFMPFSTSSAACNICHSAQMPVISP